MTPRDAEQLLHTLKDKSLTLEEIHGRVRASGSAWSQAQVQLFLLCTSDVQYDKLADTYRAVSCEGEGSLQHAILEAVRSFAGKPVPAVQVRARLPNHFVTTDEQIVAVARRTDALELFGPNLIRITKK